MPFTTVYWNANGGSVSPTSSPNLTPDNPLTPPTPTRSGHAFCGWFTTSSGGTKIPAYVPHNDTTYYALWAGHPLTSASQFQDCGDICLLARLVYGEASNNKQEQTGCAYVVKNRLQKGTWGNTYKSVILSPKQFTAMNGGQTLDPVLTSSKWTNSLDVALNFTSYTNPIGTRMYFWPNDLYENEGASHKNPVIFGGTTFFDW